MSAAPRWLDAACRGFAALGGLLLLAAMAVTVLSVLRRGLLGAPIPGDFELVEMAVAAAIFCCLPYAQRSGANVALDLFTRRLSMRGRARLAALGDALYLVIALILLWRMIPGLIELRGYGERSMVLGLPVWWGYLPVLPALALLAVACAASLIGRLRAAA